jgi:hypothetical protein
MIIFGGVAGRGTGAGAGTYCAAAAGCSRITVSEMRVTGRIVVVVAT